MYSRHRSAVLHSTHVDPHDGPTVYKADPIQTRKFRFQATAAGQFNVTRQNLLSLFFCNLASGTANSGAMAGIKLRRVQIWGTGVSGGGLTLAPISLQWISENAPEVEISSAGNANHLAYITTTPPAGTLASFWSMFNSANLSQVMFFLILQGNEIVDIEVEYTPANGTERVVVTTTASGTAGFYYYGYLDGQSGTKLQPVSNPSLT